MAKEFYITSEDNPRRYYDFAYVDDIRTYSFDLSAWAEENDDVTAATWTVKAGTAGVSNQSLSSNVATALISTSQIAGALLQVKFTTAAGRAFVVYLDILVKDPSTEFDDDYGMR